MRPAFVGLTVSPLWQAYQSAELVLERQLTLPTRKLAKRMRAYVGNRILSRNGTLSWEDTHRTLQCDQGMSMADV